MPKTKCSTCVHHAHYVYRIEHGKNIITKPHSHYCQAMGEVVFYPILECSNYMDRGKMKGQGEMVCDLCKQEVSE